MLRAIPSKGSSGGLNGRNRTPNVKINHSVYVKPVGSKAVAKLANISVVRTQAVGGAVGISTLPKLA